MIQKPTSQAGKNKQAPEKTTTPKLYDTNTKHRVCLHHGYSKTIYVLVWQKGDKHLNADKRILFQSTYLFHPLMRK